VRRTSSIWLIGALAVAAATTAAHAEDFPTRPVRVIVPFAAGGPTDVAARLTAEAMRAPLGQSIVIENRGGAGGATGTDAVVNAAPDGYTLLMGGAGPLTIIPSAKTLRYTVAKDLVPIAQVWRSPQVFAVNPGLGVKTVADLVAHAKKNPGKVTVGSAGIGTLPHLSIELFKREAGIDLVHVPYRGTGAALPNLIGGQIDAMFGDVSALSPTVNDGKLTGLAITSSQRSALLPGVPTMAEAGFPTVVAENWYGLLAPAGVPPAVIKRLEAAAQAALADPTFRAGVLKQGALTMESSGAQFAELIASETARWAPIVKAIELKVD
jgi:tripartite-type tricarboxylate transporter receptor subunit TctC